MNLPQAQSVEARSGGREIHLFAECNPDASRTASVRFMSCLHMHVHTPPTRTGNDEGSDCAVRSTWRHNTRALTSSAIRFVLESFHSLMVSVSA